MDIHPSSAYEYSKSLDTSADVVFFFTMRLQVVKGKVMILMSQLAKLSRNDTVAFGTQGINYQQQTRGWDTRWGRWEKGTPDNLTIFQPSNQQYILKWSTS